MCLILAAALVLIWPCRGLFGWGREGHTVVALIAERYMTPTALKDASDLLDGATIDSVSSWADDYRRDHRETGPWHYIDIPLADSRIDMTRECPNGDCVIGKTQQFIAVLKDPKADRAAKVEALKYVVHFVGDMHQPLHDEDDNDKGGNERRVTLEGKAENLHWAWDTWLIQQINRNPEALAAQLESKITAQDRAVWLVHVADEVDDILERLDLGRTVGLRVFQHRDELLRLADNAITVRTLVRHVDSRVHQRVVDIFQGPVSR